jgi:hypothetical protein
VRDIMGFEKFSASNGAINMSSIIKREIRRNGQLSITDFKGILSLHAKQWDTCKQGEKARGKGERGKERILYLLKGYVFFTRVRVHLQ